MQKVAKETRDATDAAGITQKQQQMVGSAMDFEVEPEDLQAEEQ